MTAMCTRFTTVPINVESDSTQGSTMDPASDRAVHPLLGAPSQADGPLGVGIEAADRPIRLAPDGVPHGATSPVPI